jgi:fructose-1,6-bisphosphatase/inositol monophosphatase family enzyme
LDADHPHTVSVLELRIFAWWDKETKAREIYRKCNRKIFSRCAAEKAQRKQKHRQDALDSVNEKREEMLMQREEQRTLQHAAFLESVDFVQEVVEDLVDDTWHVIRKLPSYRSGRRAPHSPRASPAAASTATSTAPQSPGLTAKQSGKVEGDNPVTPKKSRMSNAGSIEEFLSLEFSAARALR